MLTLNSTELAELTGLVQPAAQIRWLERHSWLYEKGRDGLPKVAVAYFEKRMVDGVPAETASPAKPADWQVNTQAVRSISRRAK